MIDAIYNESALFAIIRYDCEENGYYVGFSTSIDMDTRTAILKVDAFYNSFNIRKRPPSIDFLVVLKCCDATFCLYLIELRNVGSPSSINKQNIIDKYSTTIEDFMKIRYSSIFLADQYIVKDVRLYFVTDPLRLSSSSLTAQAIERKYKNTKIDYFSTIKPFQFRNFVRRIQHMLPNPVIEDC